MSVVELQQQLEIERAKSKELEVALEEEKAQREKVEAELKHIKDLHGELARKLEMEEEALVNKVCSPSIPVLMVHCIDKITLSSLSY
jgi:DNA repair exonuclease SbcCD ATPase subunit